MKPIILSSLFIFLLSSTLKANDCLQGFLDIAELERAREEYQEAITTLQEALQKCELISSEKDSVLELLDNIYAGLRKGIEDQKNNAIKAKEVADSLREEALQKEIEAIKAKEVADSLREEAIASEKKAKVEFFRSRALLLTNQSDKAKVDFDSTKLKLAFKARIYIDSMIDKDSNQNSLPIVLETFRDAVRERFMKSYHPSNGLIYDLAFVEKEIFLAKGNKIFLHGDSIYIPAHQKAILDLQVFGKQMISIGKDHQAKIWDLENQTSIATIQHSDRINFVEISYNKNQVLTGSDDKTVILWIKDQSDTISLRHPDRVVGGGFSPDGSQFFTRTSQSKVYLWDSSGKLIKQLQEKGYVYAAAFLDHGKFLLTADAAGNIHKYDSKGQLIDSYQDIDNPAIDLKVSEDGQYYLGLFANGTGVLGHANKGIIKTFKIENRGGDSQENPFIPWRSASFVPDSSFFIVQNKKIIQRINYEGVVDTSFDQNTSITNLSVSKDGKFILTTAMGNSIKVFDTKGNLLLNISNLSTPVIAAQFSPDSKKIAAFTKDGTLITCPLPPIIFEDMKNNKPKWTPEQIQKYGLKHLESARLD